MSNENNSKNSTVKTGTGENPIDSEQQIDNGAETSAEISNGDEKTGRQEEIVNIEELQHRLEKAEALAAENQDQYLRAKAEAENVRRRSQNELISARKFAIEGFARELLPVKDSLDLAGGVEIQQGDSKAVENMMEGLALTTRQMDAVFEKFGIEVISPEVGEKLDPDRHMAMTTQESDEIQPNHIINAFQKGYLLKERLLRPAMVVVAKAVSAESDTESGVSANSDDSGDDGADSAAAKDQKGSSENELSA